MIRVSVIVPAHNAAATLPRTLDALAGQDLTEPYEVVVVDDGSDDDTATLAERSPGPVTVVRQPCLGPAEARNRGAEAARGEVLAFTDADCFPTPGWLAAGLKGLEHADLVQGAVHADPEASIEPFDRTLWVTHETGLYESANLFVAREVFDRVGGFEPVLPLPRGQHFGEDIWFGWRARRTGARTAFRSDALVHHAVFPRDARGYVAERLRLGYFAAIARRVPELRRHFFFGGYFLLPRTAAFDAMLVGAAAGAVTRRPLLVLSALPYAWMVRDYARGWGYHARRVALVEVMADAVGFGALLRGSVRRRTLVL